MTIYPVMNIWNADSGGNSMPKLYKLSSVSGVASSMKYLLMYSCRPPMGKSSAIRFLSQCFFS